MKTIPLRLMLGAALAMASAYPACAEIPNLSGFWSPPSDQHPFDPHLVAKLPAGTVIIDDAGYVEFPPMEFGGLDVKPDALERAAEWQPADELSLQKVCATPSVIYTMQGPFPFEIYQFEDVIIFKLEYFDQARVIFMDGRDRPPADAPHSNLGFSTGVWEGDELVVETTHIKASTLTNNGLDHTDGVRFVERFRLSEDGETLMSTQWFDDPAVLNNTGARFMKWNAEPGNHVLPYACDPSFAVDYDQLVPGQQLDASEFEEIE